MSRIDFREPLYRSPSGYNRIAYIQEKIAQSKDYIVDIQIQDNGRIGLPFIFLIGTLPIYGNIVGKRVRLFVSHKIYMLLSRINVVDYYNRKDAQQEIDADELLKKPAFREIKNPADIIEFVNEIYMEVPLKLTETQSDILTSRVGEIFQNALEHAKADIVVGGKYYKNAANRYCFSSYDSGMGIVDNVKQFLKAKDNTDISDVEALKWAMKRGNSTRQNGNSGGVGMSLLREFAVSNGFSIRICSGEAFYELDGQGREHWRKLEYSFKGTLFEMDIISDRLG